jgi:beta-lactamase class A
MGFWLASAAAGLCLFAVIVQLAYPAGTARPFMLLDGHSAGFWTSERAKEYVAGQAALPYQVSVDGKEYKLQNSQLGITYDTAATASNLTNYSFKQRLVPFSLMAVGNQPYIKQVDKVKLTKALSDFAAARAQDPQDASIAKDARGAYTAVEPDHPGYVVDSAKLAAIITKAGPGSRLKAPLAAVPPKISQQQLELVLADWKKQTARPVSILIGFENETIPVSSLQKWLDIKTNAKKDSVSIVYDENAIKLWLQSFVDNVYVAPQTAVTYIRDGQVTSSTAGSAGWTLDLDTTTANLIQALQKDYRIRQISASLRQLPIPTADIRSYSPSSAGIQKLLEYWNSRYAGAVSFQEIGGLGRQASIQAGKNYFTASLYKIYLAAYIYKHIENGDISGSAILSTGKSVDSCLEAMIVVSDNNCGLALGDLAGWSNVNSYVHQIGLGATTMVKYYWQTDASDTAKFLGLLYGGSLINGGDTSALLDKMGRQIYRSGIPAGSAGSTVYDKVGFYGTYWHDAAIVRGAKATYVLVALTTGSSSGPIKELAQEIQQTLNQ